LLLVTVVSGRVTKVRDSLVLGAFCHLQVSRRFEVELAARRPRSIGHPPHSSASPVELRLRVGPRALSGGKKEIRVKGVLKSVRNAPKGKKIGVRK